MVRPEDVEAHVAMSHADIAVLIFLAIIAGAVALAMGFAIGQGIHGAAVDMMGRFS